MDGGSPVGGWPRSGCPFSAALTEAAREGAWPSEPSASFVASRPLVTPEPRL